MRRWTFVLVVFAILVLLACGIETVSLLSAGAEQVAFLLVPVVFTISSAIGISKILSS